MAGVLSFGFVYLRRYRGGQLSLDVQHDLRTELFGSLTRLDGARQDQLHTGQIVSRSITDLNMIQALLSMMPMLVGNALLFVVALGVMFWLSPLLALISLAVGPALLVLSRGVPAPAVPGQLGRAAEGRRGGRRRRGRGHRRPRREGLRPGEPGDRPAGDSSAASCTRRGCRTVRMMARFSPALGAIPALGQVGVLALGGWLAIKGSISLGTFLAFASYLAQMVNPVRALTNLITIGQEARASVIRVFEVIDSRPVLTEKPGRDRRCRRASKDVELDDVHFGYLPSEPVCAGCRCGSGRARRSPWSARSGSGKSTISLLLPRFYDVRSGAIRVGGHDVRDVTLDSLAASSAWCWRRASCSPTPSRQHLLRPPGRHRRADRGRGPGGRGRGVHPRAARRIRHRRRRAGPHPVRRPAPAGRAGPRADHRPVDPGPRRRDLRDRRRGRGADPRHPAQGDGRAAPRC